MKTCSLVLLLGLALVGPAFAEDTPAPEMQRGFADGKYVDDFLGIVYQADDLKEGFAIGGGGATVLWAGKCAGGVDVELQAQEIPHEMSAKDWRDGFKKMWAQDGKKREEMEEGDEPNPWALFVQESLAGFRRHHGYMFYPRGTLCFVVHAQVREKSDTSGEAIQKALAGLTLKDAPNASLVVHMAAKQMGAPPNDPRVLLGAAQMYLSDQVNNPVMALRLAEAAKAAAQPDTFDANATWQLWSTIGLAQLKLGKIDEALPTWQKCIELAAKTEEPAALAMNAWYNLACGYALGGKVDEAFEALGKAYAAGPAEAVAGLKEHAQSDPDLEPLRADERWKDL